MKILECHTPQPFCSLNSNDYKDCIIRYYADTTYFTNKYWKLVLQQFRCKTYALTNIVIELKEKSIFHLDISEGIVLEYVLKGNPDGNILDLPKDNNYRVSKRKASETTIVLDIGLKHLVYIELNENFPYELPTVGAAATAIPGSCSRDYNSDKSLDCVINFEVSQILNKILTFPNTGNVLCINIQSCIGELIVNYTRKQGERLNYNLSPSINIPNKDVLIEIAELVEKDPNIHESFDYYSRKFHSSYNFIKVGFKELYNMTLPQYIEKECMKKAHYLLTNTDASIDDISFALGYSAITAFSRAYRRKYGKAPSEERFKEKTKMY